MREKKVVCLFFSTVSVIVFFILFFKDHFLNFNEVQNYSSKYFEPYTSIR